MDQETMTSSVPAMTEEDTASSASKARSTLYPNIGKFRDFLHNFGLTLPSTRIVPLIGSVKLHGAHADWVISSDDIIRVQSRNFLDVPSTKDPSGLVAFTTPIRTNILRLRDDILRRYTKSNPEVCPDPKHSVIIAGEWCGRGIQKGMAISQLPRHFVIISIYVNDAWVPESEHADLKDEAHGIYSVGMTGFYRLDLNLDNIDDSEAAIQALVTNVERLCPYGLMRGVTGKGEGIVWKALDHAQSPELWFKYKGDSTAVSYSWKPSATAVAAANPQREDNFATAVVTAQRLEQGWEYLKETDVPRNEAGMGKFLAWITNDIFTEEIQEMKEKIISKGKLKPAIKAIAAPWYKKRLTETIQEDKTQTDRVSDMMENLTT
ncbi:MAG: hypothetical protein L6R37_002721 [Teloschistes peruensis]|nr:MAG: hypothetical protein L6R37_002721 [Teloschistes peruensis]